MSAAALERNRKLTCGSRQHSATETPTPYTKGFFPKVCVFLLFQLAGPTVRTSADARLSGYKRNLSGGVRPGDRELSRVEG